MPTGLRAHPPPGPPPLRRRRAPELFDVWSLLHNTNSIGTVRLSKHVNGESHKALREAYAKLGIIEDVIVE